MTLPMPGPSTDVTPAGHRGDWTGGAFHRPHPDGPIRWASPTTMATKRWTDGEAARDALTTTMATADGTPQDQELTRRQALTLHRFAATPHAFPEGTRA